MKEKRLKKAIASTSFEVGALLYLPPYGGRSAQKVNAARAFIKRRRDVMFIQALFQRRKPKDI
jgi:hypothetical protein